MAIIHRDPLTELTHWNPFGYGEPLRGLENLQREINRLFDRLPGGSEMQSLVLIPAAEMEETDDMIYLKLEVPGMEAKDLDVEVMEGAISIKGERKSESKMEKKGMVRSEFHYGKFERSIPLPTHIQTDKIQAECKNGMLSLTLPKVESEQRKSVKVPIS